MRNCRRLLADRYSKRIVAIGVKAFEIAVMRATLTGLSTKILKSKNDKPRQLTLPGFAFSD